MYVIVPKTCNKRMNRGKNPVIPEKVFKGINVNNTMSSTTEPLYYSAEH